MKNTSRRYYGWHRPKILFGQQDGRVVKAPSFGGERTKYTPDMPVLNNAAKKSIGWAVGDEKHVPSLQWQAYQAKIKKGQQDGRVVKAPSFGGERTKYTPDMPDSNPATRKSPPGRVGA